ncbi:hypothetical protein LINPERPRIM_LOCUS20600 [Linum perenne]
MKAHERLVFSYKSPKISVDPPPDGRVSPRVAIARPIDVRRTKSPMVRSGSETPRGVVELDEHSLWTALFQDLKPT